LGLALFQVRFAPDRGRKETTASDATRSARFSLIVMRDKWSNCAGVIDLMTATTPIEQNTLLTAFAIVKPLRGYSFDLDDLTVVEYSPTDSFPIFKMGISDQCLCQSEPFAEHGRLSPIVADALDPSAG
jgi:hypothetical protein